MRTKVCSKCGVEKAFDTDFHRNRNMPGGRHPYCKVCKRQADKVSRESQPERLERVRARARQHYYDNQEKKRKQVLDYQYGKKIEAATILGGKCERCGFDHPAALQFHHKDPATKRFQISTKTLASPKIYPWEEVVREIQKCELLCANCHAVEHSRWEIDE